MSANLTIPADVWACRQPGVPLVAAIVEGERYADDAMGRTTFTPPRPPAWLVALRDARCETCGGEGHLEGRNIASWDGCYACDATGRLLHDVRVETYCPQQCDVWPCKWPERDCSAGAYHRTVRCLVDVASVVSWHDCTDRTMHVCFGNDAWTASGAIFHTALDQPGETEHLLTPAHVDALAAACGKPPADWVGGCAAILTEVGV